MKPAPTKSDTVTYCTEKVECKICGGYGFYWTASEGIERKIRCWCCHGSGKMFKLQED